MKQIRFESNNKQWLVVDITNSIEEAYQDGDTFYKLISKLSEITEEQASEVVDCRLIFQSKYIKDMLTVFTDYENSNSAFKSSIDSLHSLLKSKGVDDTWINPVIFEVR